MLEFDIFQNNIKTFFTVPTIWFGTTLRTLNLTVLLKDLHYPQKIISPSFGEKQGEQWTGIFLCLFSNLLYFFTKCK